ncbi:MAG: hypothetical protein ACK55I_05225 [bacterium]
MGAEESSAFAAWPPTITINPTVSSTESRRIVMGSVQQGGVRGPVTRRAVPRHAGGLHLAQAVAGSPNFCSVSTQFVEQ